MTDKIFQIQITLKGSKPKIWRRVLVPSDLLLSDFHKIIQTTMGWDNFHLHQFIKGRKFYLIKDPDEDTWWDDSYKIDYEKKRLRISDLIKREKNKIIYEYDFGDSWRHDIILEKILPVDDKIKYPVCVTGRRHCPPEDCGGIWGYARILNILKDPDNEEYEEIIEWLGEDFDPKYFDKDEVNEFLQTKNYGCIEFQI